MPSYADDPFASIQRRRRRGAYGGIGQLPAPTPATTNFYHPAAVYDLDYLNQRFWFNGVRYNSVAAMVAAGFYTVDPVNGDRANVTGLLPATYTMFFSGTTSSATAPANPEYAWNLKGSGAVGANSAYCYRANGTPIPHSVGADSAGTIQWDLTGSSAAASSPITIATRVQANNIAGSFSSGAIQTDGTATIPTFTTLYIGNRSDGTRPWGGTVGRITCIALTNGSRELERMAALFVGLDQNTIFNAIQEPFQMEPNLAQQRNGLLHVAYATSNGPTASAVGSTYIGEIDVSRKRMVRERVLHDYSIADEHLCPTWIDLSDGSSFAGGTGHNTGSLIYWRTTPDGTLANLGAETQYSSTLVEPNYMSLVQRTPTEMFLLTNEDKANGGTDFKPNIVYERMTLSSGVWTPNPCRPFTGRDSIFPPNPGAQNQLYYAQTRQSADVAWNFGVIHDSNDNAQFRLVEVNLASGDVITRNDAGTATVQGNMFLNTSSTTPIIDHDNLPRPWPLTAGKKQVELIIKDDASMALVQEVDNGTDSGNSVLWLYKRLNSNPFSQASWSRIALPFGGYYTDATFTREPNVGGIRIYITRQSGSFYYLTQCDSADGGFTWSYIDLIRSTLELRRPVSPVGCDSRMPVICCQYVYRLNYDNFSSRIVWP